MFLQSVVLATSDVDRDDCQGYKLQAVLLFKAVELVSYSGRVVATPAGLEYVSDSTIVSA